MNLVVVFKQSITTHDTHLKRQVLATIFFVSLFIWFGLIQEHDDTRESVRLDAPDRNAFQPKIVSDLPKKKQAEFGIISTDDHYSKDFNMISDKPEERNKGFALIKDNTINIAAVREQMVISAYQHEPDGYKLAIKQDAPVAYAMRKNEQGNYQGLYLDNQGLWNNVKGFAGPIYLGVYIDADGKIRKLVHLVSNETPSYLHRIAKSGFYDQFKGLRLANDHYQIDAVTGATISTKAMAQTLSALINDAAESPLDEYLPVSTQGFTVSAKLSNVWILHATLIGALFAFFWQRRLRQNRTLMTFAGIVSLLYIGFWLNNSFTYVTLLHPFLGVSISMFAAIYAALVLLGSIWDKNTYCKHVCPFGYAQRFAYRLDKKSRWINWPMANTTMYIVRLVFTLILIFIIVMLDGYEYWLGFELYPDFFGPDYRNIWWSVSLMMILWFSVWIPNLWCRLLCPTGAVLDFITDLMKPGKIKQRFIAYFN